MNIPVFSEGNNLIPTVRWNNSYFLAGLQGSENEIAAASFFLSFPRSLPGRAALWDSLCIANELGLQPSLVPPSLLIPATCSVLDLGFVRGHPVPWWGRRSSHLAEVGQQEGPFGRLWHLFERSFIHSLMASSDGLFLYSRLHSLANSFIQLLTNSFIYSQIHSFTHHPINSLNDSFIHLLSLQHLIHSLTNSFINPFIHSFIHQHIHSSFLTHSFTHHLIHSHND